MDRAVITCWCTIQTVLHACTHMSFSIALLPSPPTHVKYEVGAGSLSNQVISRVAFERCYFIFASFCQIFNWEMCLPLAVRWFAFQLNVDSLLFISWPLITSLIGKTDLAVTWGDLIETTEQSFCRQTLATDVKEVWRQVEGSRFINFHVFTEDGISKT